MSITTKLGDEFLRIPKLDVSGTNWVIFKDRFTWALDARGILDHIDGSGSEPTEPVEEGDKTDAEKHEKLVAEWKKDVKEWKQGEAIAKQQIASSIPDSLFMKVRAKGTAHEIWTELGKHFEKRSRMVSIDLRRRLQELRCADKGSIIDHFATLRTMREDLASMGESLTENDFYSIIMGSLPPSYDPYLSALNATSSVLGTHLSAEDLMLSITEEYERRALKSKNGKKDDNAAYSADASSSKGQKGNSHQKKRGECHNCGKKGHWSRDCWEEGGGKEGQGPKQKAKKERDEKGKGKGKGKDVAATAKDDKDDKSKPDKEEEAWMVMIMDETDSEEDELNTYPVNDDLSLPNLFDGIDETLDDGDAVMDVDQLIDADPEEEIETGLEAAYLVGTAETRSAEVDLYDSGTTRHMSGFLHRMINYVETSDPFTQLAKETCMCTYPIVTNPTRVSY
jgi:hypothetical protein